MKYSFEDYEKAMNDLRDEIYSVRDEKLRSDYSYGLEKAQEEYLTSARDAYKEYKHSTNPYGNNFEKISSAGLGSSGKERSILGKDFSEYQMKLSDAIKEKKDITTSLIRDLLSSQAENDEEKLSSAMDLARERMENYWKEYSWNYRLERDKLEDERYEKELKAKYK
ncbi:MAG: hypothetical protein IKM61_08345 [Eubacteriaceae bacterium]|nr:hypothetical protein [Eubacteriaceae bacterium]